MNKVKMFLVGATTAFAAIGIYSFRPLPDERLFHKQPEIRPGAGMPVTPNYESALPYNYTPGNASGSKALK